MKVLALVLAAALTACSSDAEESHTNPPGSSDAAVIAQLRTAGSDLSRPHPIDFYLYFPNREAAGRISRTLSSKGFEASIEPSARGTDWLVLAKKQVVPTQTAMERLSAELEVIAASEKGEYDGWETMVIR